MDQTAETRTEQDSSQELRILDGRGCVTPEALCFLDQLGADQRAVVERHVRACVVCAQQRAEVVGVAGRLGAARPRIAVPAEVKLLAREVVRRVIAAQRSQDSQQTRRRRRRPTARIRLMGSRRPWYRSSTLWTAVLAGLATASLAALVGLLLG